MVFITDWPQTLLYVMCGVVHGQLVFMRLGPEPRRARSVSYFAGCGRRRLATQRAGHLERYILAGEAWHGVRGLRNCSRCGSDDRSLARRLDHRQFFMAMDFLY